MPTWLLAALGLRVLFLLCNLVLQYGAARLPANVTAMVMLSDVVVAAGSAFLLGGGEPTLRLVLGGALIIAAAVLAGLERRR